VQASNGNPYINIFASLWSYKKSLAGRLLGRASVAGVPLEGPKIDTFCPLKPDTSGPAFDASLASKPLKFVFLFTVFLPKPV
jgi:hypothetical protein